VTGVTAVDPPSVALPFVTLPFVTLIVAMRNEERHIARCVESLLAQDYPADRLEVLFMDGRSTDRTRALVTERIAGRPGFAVVDNPGQIQSIAWNLGIERARGDLVGIVSGHSELAPDYVTQVVETLGRTGADLVGGPARAESETVVGEAIALAMSTPFGVGGAEFRYATEEHEVDTVFMGVCKRALYEQIGGFDAEMVRNQDDELSYRLLAHGGRIVCNPKIGSVYRNRATLRSLWKQYFDYGRWKVRVMQKHRSQMRPRQFVPPVFVATLGASALAPPLFTAIAGTYSAAALAMSVYLAAKARRIDVLPYLPAAFAILHVGYGLGFLRGLYQFRDRWQDRAPRAPQFTRAAERST
jgi:cellulose synthase/poly-beta-1,6-N-acetylglucosamine synthase-like glycosyltransferase